MTTQTATTASQIRPGDFLWTTPASEAIKVDKVELIAGFVVVSGTVGAFGRDDVLTGKHRRRFFAASDTVPVSR
jgi:hypothetical protein